MDDQQNTLFKAHSCVIERSRASVKRSTYIQSGQACCILDVGHLGQLVVGQISVEYEVKQWYIRDNLLGSNIAIDVRSLNASSATLVMALLDSDLCEVKLLEKSNLRNKQYFKIVQGSHVRHVGDGVVVKEPTEISE